MGKETLSNYCCGNLGESSCEVEKNNFCPVCEKQGTLVKNITVKHMVLNELTEQIGDNDYYLCMNEECDITYYNTKFNVKFNKQQVKVPIWFKKDADPKYACYCSEVTEDQVIEAVVKHGAKTVRIAVKNGEKLAYPKGVRLK
jgi:hypothetical protein